MACPIQLSATWLGVQASRPLENRGRSFERYRVERIARLSNRSSPAPCAPGRGVSQHILLSTSAMRASRRNEQSCPQSVARSAQHKQYDAPQRIRRLASQSEMMTEASL